MIWLHTFIAAFGGSFLGYLCAWWLTQRRSRQHADVLYRMGDNQ